MMSRKLYYLVSWVVLSVDEFFLFLSNKQNLDYDLIFIGQEQVINGPVVYKFLLGVDHEPVMEKFKENFSSIEIKQADLSMIAQYSKQQPFEQYWKSMSGTEQTAHLDYVMFLINGNEAFMSLDNQEGPDVDGIP